jgi:chorismate-pyruvate lyase
MKVTPMTGVTWSDDSCVNIRELLDEFYEAPIGHAQLGMFEPVTSVPAPYDSLLDHHEHMTVTVESHYAEPVDVHVHRSERNGDSYAREITLVTSKSRQVVMYGIVRIDTSVLAPDVWQQIESQEIPLGRVLIEHDVLREVQMCDLVRVKAGVSLAQTMRLDIGDVLYGRTALIYCHGHAAIELLEIVAPTRAHESSCQK